MVSYQRYGGMAEWLKAAVLKTVEPQGSVGSNPTSSARLHTPGPPGVFFSKELGRIRTDKVVFTLEKRASGTFLVKRPTELAREGCGFAKRIRESYFLRQELKSARNLR